MSKWIDCNDYDTKVGTIGYLDETINTNNGGTSWGLNERALRTNQSLEPRLHGWCGSTNNRSAHARGVWKVERMNAGGDRAQIVQLHGAELAAFLERDGYPELIPAELLAPEVSS